MKLWRTLLVLLAAVSLVAAACGGDDDDDDAAAPDETEDTEAEDGDAEAGCEATVPGSQIDYGVYAPTAQLDPPQVSGSLVGGTELAAIYDVLMKYDAEANAYEPHLAESLEPNDDNTVWTLKLREGVTYSDGTPLDAQLVSDNIDRLLQPGIRNTSGGFLNTIETKTVVDDLTLEFTLKQPWASFEFALADEPGMVVNLKAMGTDPANAAQPPEAAGVGPYVVERNVPGEELVMKARQEYWGGPVCVETLRFVFVPGSRATLDALKSGQLDVGFLRDETVIDEAETEGYEGFIEDQSGGAILLLNHGEGRPAADAKVREAIALAIDPEVINSRAYGGNLNATKSIIQPETRYDSDGIETFEVDAEAAKAALDEAKANGFDGKLDLLCANVPPAPETALASEALLEAIGFEVTVTTKPTAEQIGQVITGDFDAACWGYNISASTGVTAIRSNVRSDSNSNRTKYGSPEMDEALDALLAAEDDDARQEAFAEVNRIYLEDFVSVPFGAPREGIVWTDQVKGVHHHSASIFLFDKAYLEE